MIPRNLFHIWVGPLPAPTRWMDTWRKFHPEWNYKLWDNDAVLGQSWENQKHIEHYWRLADWPGVADILRYEILWRFGGFMPGADSECLAPVDELLTHEFDAFAVYEHERLRPGYVTPLYACSQRNEFARILIDGLSAKTKLGKPFLTTGNAYMQATIAAAQYPRLKIWPSHYFNPIHHTGAKYAGDGPVYAMQHWGTTHRAYAEGV